MIVGVLVLVLRRVIFAPAGGPAGPSAIESLNLELEPTRPAAGIRCSPPKLGEFQLSKHAGANLLLVEVFAPLGWYGHRHCCITCATNRKVGMLQRRGISSHDRRRSVTLRYKRAR